MIRTAFVSPPWLRHPAAIECDAQGRVIVLDKDNSRVQVFAEIATSAKRETWGVVKQRWR